MLYSPSVVFGFTNLVGSLAWLVCLMCVLLFMFVCLSVCLLVDISNCSYLIVNSFPCPVAHLMMVFLLCLFVGLIVCSLFVCFSKEEFRSKVAFKRKRHFSSSLCVLPANVFWFLLGIYPVHQNNSSTHAHLNGRNALTPHNDAAGFVGSIRWWLVVSFCFFPSRTSTLHAHTHTSRIKVKITTIKWLVSWNSLKAFSPEFVFVLDQRLCIYHIFPFSLLCFSFFFSPFPFLLTQSVPTGNGKSS